MNKIILKIFTFFISLGIVGVTGFLILHNEQENKRIKHANAQDYYSEQYKLWMDYKKEYDLKVLEIKQANLKEMTEAKLTYEKLLVDQPQLIKEHTRLVASGVTSSQTQQNTAATSSKKSSTTVQVSKPKSQPKTRAS